MLFAWVMLHECNDLKNKNMLKNTQTILWQQTQVTYFEWKKFIYTNGHPVKRRKLYQSIPALHKMNRVFYTFGLLFFLPAIFPTPPCFFFLMGGFWVSCFFRCSQAIFLIFSHTSGLSAEKCRENFFSYLESTK